MLTIPECAFLALCRLASPLASPGPRCSRVEAGVPFMRKYPSAAPVTTPSNRPSTQRIPSTRSSAATKCISEVPGLAKQTLTPPATKVRTRLSAPFIVPLPFGYLRQRLPQINHCSAISSKGAGDIAHRHECRGFLSERRKSAGLTWLWLARRRPIWPVVATGHDCRGEENEAGSCHFGRVGGAPCYGQSSARPGLCWQLLERRSLLLRRWRRSGSARG